MQKEPNYDNDGLDPSEEYFRKKKKGNDDYTYFPLEESEPPHYWEWSWGIHHHNFWHKLKE